MSETIDVSPFTPRLEAHQVRTMLATLRSVDAYFQQTGQFYFLTGGALIGYVRYGHVLPWDCDIDLHCYGTLAIDPRLIYRLGLEVTLSPHSIQFRKKKCRPLVEVLPLTPEGTIAFKGKVYDVGHMGVRRAEFSGVEVSIPNDPDKILDSGYGPAWRSEAVPPGWDHIRRKRIVTDGKPVPVEALQPIVDRFRETHL